MDRLLGNSFWRKLLGIMSASGLIAFAVMLGGCGQSEMESAMPTPSPGVNPASSAPPSAPATPVKQTFDQLTLESPVTRTANKNGPVYLQFSYRDRDGKVYKCVMPEAMAKGSYLPDEWISTFNIYRIATTAKQKASDKPVKKSVNDFPFISPKPAPAQKQASASKPIPINVPNPQSPTSPSTSSSSSGEISAHGDVSAHPAN